MSSIFVPKASPPPCMKDSIDSATSDNLSQQSQSQQSGESPLPSHKDLEHSLPSQQELDSTLSNNRDAETSLSNNENSVSHMKEDSLPSNKNESPLPSNKNLDSPLPSNKSVSLKTPSVGNSVESTYAHVLFYCGVYDSARTQYALQTIRNMILPNSRAFLCAAATTALTPR